MTTPKTLTSQHEQAILETLNNLKRLEGVQELMHPASYKATQREVLRNLVKKALLNEFIK